MENKYCVYEHINSKTNEVFYVGSGNMNRPYDLRNDWRNNLWNEYVKDLGVNNIIINIVYKNLSKEEALNKEINLTEYYIDIQQCFCNKKIGNKQNSSTKYLVSLKNKGRQLTKEQKENISKNTKGKNNGMYGKKHLKETKIKISNSNKGKVISEEHKEKLRKLHTGNKYGLGYRHTKEAKNKISNSLKGSKNPNSKNIIVIFNDKKYIFDTLNETYIFMKNEYNINKKTIQRLLHSNTPWTNIKRIEHRKYEGLIIKYLEE